MIIQYHTPEGIFPADSGTVTDVELAKFGVLRSTMEKTVAESRNPQERIDELEARLRILEGS